MWDRIGLLNQEKAARRGMDGERGITCSFSSSESEKSKIPFTLQKPQYKQDFPRGEFCSFKVHLTYSLFIQLLFCINYFSKLSK